VGAIDKRLLPRLPRDCWLLVSVESGGTLGLVGLDLLRSEKGDPLFSHEGGRIDMTLTWKFPWQPAATHGKTFRLFEPPSALLHLPAAATRCDRSAP
jgi:hypothetical protein